MQPGDLVFFAGADGTPTSPGHVGLVIGDGKMIEAYATGFPIRVATYTDRDPIGFTRPWANAEHEPDSPPPRLPHCPLADRFGAVLSPAVHLTVR